MPAGSSNSDELGFPSPKEQAGQGHAFFFEEDGLGAPGSVPLKLLEARASARRLVQIIEEDGRYHVDAFRFLQEGLEFTVRRIHGDGAYEEPAPTPADKAKAPGDTQDPRHVDGAQLCLGLRDLAAIRWGRLARVVLNGWGVYSTRDFGEMVFVLVKNDFLQKTERDTLDDFEDIFPLADLERDYLMTCDRLHADDLSTQPSLALETVHWKSSGTSE